MIFNGYDFSQYWYVKRELPLVPTRTVVEKSLPGMAGSRHVRSEFEPLDIPVTMRLKLPEGMTDPTTVNYIKRLAGQALSASEPRELMFYEEPDARYMAVCTDASGFDLPAFTGGVEIMFHCSDPFAYYQFERIQNVEEGLNEFPLAGSWRIMPTFNLVTKATNSVIITNHDGRFVKCRGPFSAGDKLTVDFTKGFVYRNGILSQFTLDSRFFEIYPGGNSITIQGIQSGSITFKERSV